MPFVKVLAFPRSLWNGGRGGGHFLFGSLTHTTYPGVHRNISILALRPKLGLQVAQSSFRPYFRGFHQVNKTGCCTSGLRVKDSFSFAHIWPWPRAFHTNKNYLYQKFFHVKIEAIVNFLQTPLNLWPAHNFRKFDFPRPFLV